MHNTSSPKTIGCVKKEAMQRVIPTQGENASRVEGNHLIKTAQEKTFEKLKHSEYVSEAVFISRILRRDVGDFLFALKSNMRKRLEWC